MADSFENIIGIEGHVPAVAPEDSDRILGWWRGLVLNEEFTTAHVHPFHGPSEAQYFNPSWKISLASDQGMWKAS